MKSIRGAMILVSALMLLFIAQSSARAAFTQQYNLGVGADAGFGGVTSYQRGVDGALALGTHLEAQYFIVGGIALNFHFLWERYFYQIDTTEYNYFLGTFVRVKSTEPMDLFPFVLMLRIYIPIMDTLEGFVGIGPGFSLYRTDLIGNGVEFRFLMDMQAGIEYEILDNLTIRGMVDIMLPNIAPRYHGERVMTRFMFNGGATYYVSLLP